MEDRKNKIKQFHKSTMTGLLGKGGDEKVDFITDMGLDANAFKIGWVSNQFQHRKEKSELEALEKEGVLIQAGGNNRFGGKSYGCFGAKGYVIPLYDTNGEMVNLYAFYPNHVTKEPEFLNDNGVFPKYPKSKTTRLFILNDVISAASLIQSDALGNRDGVISLFDGKLKPQHEELIQNLANLEELVFIGVSDDVIQELQEEFKYLDISTVELPEGESMNDMLLTYDDGLEDYIDENLIRLSSTNTQAQNLPQLSKSGLVEVNPQLHQFNTAIGLFKVVGHLPIDLGNLKFKVKLNNGSVYTVINDYHKINTFKGWLVKQYDLQSEEVEQAVNDLVNAVETKVEEKVNDYHNSKSGNAVSLTPKAQEKAVKWLQRSKDVLSDIGELIKETGLVGEEKNALLCFVIAVSYKFDYQLHGIIQGRSGNGKSYLLKTILKCMPINDRLDLTSVSPKAFQNSISNQLHKKFIGIEDSTGIPRNAMYSLRESQSGDSINYMTVERDMYGNKDAVINNVKTEYSSLMTTTKDNIYYDNQSRSLLIGIDESEEQTQRIADYDNAGWRGEIDYDKQEAVRQEIANLVSVLDSFEVVNPFAGNVILPTNADSYRRLNTQFNYVINVIALLNQYHRKRDKKDRLIVQLEDVRQAIEIFYGCIKLKMDDLSNSQRTFYERLKEEFPIQRDKEPIIYRKQVEEKFGIKKSAASSNLNGLVKAGYLRAEGNANKGYQYRIIERDDFQSMTEGVLEGLMNQLDSKAA